MHILLALLGVSPEETASALPVRQAPSRLRLRSGLIGLMSGAGAYGIMSLVIGGLAAAPYQLLGQPAWFRLLGLVVAVPVLWVAWRVGGIQRRIYLRRLMQREGLLPSSH